MPGSSSMVAVADDLTGAAEISALAHAFGLRTGLVGARGGSIADTPCTVFDSDSRLLPAVQAAELLDTLGRSLAVAAPSFVFKKIDSVLRGNVVSEAVALAKTQGYTRVLLVPANPSLGRTISGGRYFIAGKPIGQTAFAHDPHHPATSSNVADLLGSAPAWPVHVATLTEELPAQGVIVGEVSSSDDVQAWAGRLPPDALPAGGAEFFAACLRHRGLRRSGEGLPAAAAPVLILTGSLTPARDAMLARARSAGWPHIPMPPALARPGTAPDVFTKWSHEVHQALSTAGRATTESPRCDLEVSGASSAIRDAFARLVQTLRARAVLSHLVVEGGATSAAIADAAGWNRFDVLGAWAPGVVSLRATGPQQNPVFTIKPGSYSWPETLWQHLASQNGAPAT